VESHASARTSWIILGVGLLVGLGTGLLLFYGIPAWPVSGQPFVTPGGPTLTPAPAAVVGAPAPDFTLTDVAGNAVTLSKLKGQVVLINFWATWCGPCRVEMPAIQRRYEAFKDQGLTVLAVNFDEPLIDVSAFQNSFNLTFPVLLDPGGIVNDLYRMRGYPSSFMVDRSGLITKLHIGLMTEKQLDNYLAGLGLK
jgi:peroxiredoxin